MASRAFATPLLLAVLALLAWGAFLQPPRSSPFAKPDLLTWLLTPEPHRAYGEMPVVPLGSQPAFVARQLCAEPALCGGLQIWSDGNAVFKDVDGLVRVAAELHRSGQSGQLFARTTESELFVLADGTEQAWRRLSLPSPEAEPAGKNRGGELLALRSLEGPVYAVVFAPDGKTLASTSFDRTARLWEAASGREKLEVIRTRKDEVNILRNELSGELRSGLGPKAASIIERLRDQEVKLAEAEREYAMSSSWLALRGHEGGVTAVAFAPHGKTLASASDDNTARLWEAASGRELLVLRGHEAPVYAVAFAPDGRTLASASGDGTVRLWEAAGGKELLALRGHGARVNGVAFAPDGKTLASASGDGTVRLWAVGEGATRPIVHGITTSEEGNLWAVGAAGYAAFRRDGRPWTRAGAGPADLVAVAAIGAERALALSGGNTLIPLNVGLEAIVLPPLPITVAGERRLRSIAFRDERTGWAVGDEGLILHTADGGQSWSKLHEQPGLALADLHLESSGVGWAIGRAVGGRQVVLAADRAEAAQGTADGWRELPHHAPPWLFLLGVPGLLLAGFVNLRVWRPDPAPPLDSIQEMATNDAPLGWNDPEAQALKPIVGGLSRFLRNVNTKPPLTLAITGRWGSGKSSLMQLLMADLQHHGGRAVWFNA